MSAGVVYSPVAIRDIDRVYAEVLSASKDAETALLYVDELMDHISAKKDVPRSGAPLYYESGFTGFYFVVFKAYLAFYHVEADGLFVDRVLFGRSDYIRTLFGKMDRT